MIVYTAIIITACISLHVIVSDSNIFIVVSVQSCHSGHCNANVHRRLR